MNSIDVIKNIYKPYRLTKKGKTTIINSTTGSYVIKEKGQDIKKLYAYLKSRHIDSFPELVDDTRSDINLFTYVEETPMPKEEKLYDMAKVIANLHSKTYYYKEVSEDTYKSIYDNIKNNLIYLDNSYESYYTKFLEEVYPSPSHYLFLRHFNTLKKTLNTLNKDLDDYYDLVKTKKEQRVSLIHNNLSLEHYLKSDKDYLISWDKSCFDTPILDLYNLYKKEFMTHNFIAFFKKYYEVFPLNKEEEHLLYLLIRIPNELKFNGTAYEDTEEVRNTLDYVYKTKEIIEELTKTS